MTTSALTWNLDRQATFNKLADNTSIYEAVRVFKELTTPSVVLRMVETYTRPKTSAKAN